MTVEARKWFTIPYASGKIFEVYVDNMKNSKGWYYLVMHLIMVAHKSISEAQTITFKIC